MAEQTSDDVWNRKKTPLQRFKWLIVAGAVVVILLLLVALAPTIASMGWARSIVVGQINKNLNGELTIEDWSLGWGSGIEVKGVRLKQDGAQVLEAKEITTELTVNDVISGEYFSLGKTRVKGLGFVFKRYADGTNNFEKLVKKSKEKKEPFKWPDDIQVDFVGDFHGTIEEELGDGKSRVTFVDQSRATLKLTKLDAPISHKVELVMRMGDSGQTGTLTAEGSIKAFNAKKELLDWTQMVADESVSLQQIELASLAPFLPADAPINALKGMTNAKVSVRLAASDEIQVEGEAGSVDFAVGGPAMSGDVYRTKKLVVRIPPTTWNRATKRIRVGQPGQEGRLALETDQATAYVTMNATQEALTRFASNQNPGSEGTVTATVNVDLAALANQLPRLFALQEGMQLTGGRLDAVHNVTFAPDKAIIKQQVSLTDLKGVREGRTVSASPIHLTFDATSLGGGGAVPDLRNLVLVVKSGFGQVDGSGESISKLAVNGNVSLAKLQQELGQFVDFKKMGLDALEGEATFTVATSGDLTKPNGSADVDLTLVGKQLRIAGPFAEPLNEPWLKLSTKGKLQRGKTQFVQSMTDTTVTFQTGNEQKPTIDAKAVGTVVFATEKVAPAAEGAEATTRTVMRFDPMDVTATVDLPAAQEELAPALSFLRSRGVYFPNGVVKVAGAGSYDGTNASFKNLSVNANGLTFERVKAQGQKVAVLKDYTSTLELAGSVSNETTGTTLKLSKFIYDDKAGLLKVEKAPGDLAIVLPAAGGFTGSGKVTIAGNLKSVSDVMEALGERQLASGPGAGQLKSGKLAGTLELVRQQGESMVIGDLNVTELSVSTFQKPIENERVTISLRVSAKDDGSAILAGLVELKSSFANVIVSDATLRLAAAGKDKPAPGPLEVFEKGRVRFDVPNVPVLIALVEAVTPPPAPTTRPVNVAAARPARPAAPAGNLTPVRADEIPPEELPPVVLKSASARGTLTVERTEKGISLTIEDLVGRGIAFERGKGSFGPVDVSLAVQAVVVPDAKPDVDDILRKIAEIQVTRFDGSLNVVDVKLEEPLVIKDLAGALSATGTIRLGGDVANVGHLLDTLQGKARGEMFDYGGRLSLVQKFSTQGKTITAAGELEIRDFTVGNPRQPRFREGAVRIVNDVSVNQHAKRIDVKNFAVEMNDSKALMVAVAGDIDRYDTQRIFKKLEVTLGYDVVALRKIAQPFIDNMDKETRQLIAEIQVHGVTRDRKFVISGKLPDFEDDGRTRPDPLTYLVVQGELLFDTIEYAGLKVEKLQLPIHFQKGILETLYADREGAERYAPPAALNGGTIDLSGLRVSLFGKHLHVSSRREEHKVLENVAVNKEFIDKFLGSANPLFAGPENARGMITLTANELRELPLDKSLMRAGRNDRSVGRFTFSITDFAIKNGFIKLLASQMRMQVNPDGTLPASVRSATVTIDDGKVHSNVPLDLGGQTIEIRDSVVTLYNERIERMDMLIPKGLLTGIPGADRALPFVKDKLVVPVTGTLREPKYDIPGALLKSFDPRGLLQRPNTDSLPGQGNQPNTPGTPNKPEVPGRPKLPF